VHKLRRGREEVVEEAREARRELEEYRVRFALDIGLYVQEYDCDAVAAALLSELVQDQAGTFELGFAWGGLVDEACIEADDEDRRGLGSQGMLAWMKRGWRVRARARARARGGER